VADRPQCGCGAQDEFDHAPGCSKATRQMADQPYTEADVELLAPVLQRARTKTFTDTDGYLSLAFADGEELARAALDALAAAGRLLPEGAQADVMLPDGTHRYWSTHCRHGNHQLCESNAILGRTVVSDLPVAIGRVPARCKGCVSPCICPCHAGPGGGYGFMDRLSAQDQGEHR
jgi:hypothetical protein